MTKRRAFILGMVCTLALLAPCYGLLLLYANTRVAPADAGQSNIPILAPTESDEKTLLVMTGQDVPETFTLVRLDAIHQSVNVVAAPAQTVVLCDGAPFTLAQAVAQAGPAQAAAALEETLAVHVDNYLFCTAEELAQQTAPLGNARLRLVNYMSASALEQLKLAVPGVETISLTPQMLAQALAEGAASEEMEPLFRSAGYLAFLRAGHGQLEKLGPELLRHAIANWSTDLTATQVYDYQRVFKFLDGGTPQFYSAGLPGTFTGGTDSRRYELGAAALATARQYLAAEPVQNASVEDSE